MVTRPWPCPARRRLTPMEKSRMLKGMLVREAQKRASSPKMAWTTGKPTKTLFMKKMDSHATS